MSATSSRPTPYIAVLKDRSAKGEAAIREFYEGILAGGPASLLWVGVLADSHRVAFELVNLLQPCNEDDPALAVDVMDINEDGQIQKFTVFSRPRPQ